MRLGEDGGPVREHGISAATFYNWKSRFGGMDVSEAQTLRRKVKVVPHKVKVDTHKMKGTHPNRLASNSAAA